MAYIDRLQFLWDDQEQLNLLFRPEGPPTDREAMIALAKEMTLHMFSETDEFLRTLGAWKPHRRQAIRDNREASKIELADIGKYWMTLCQIRGFSAQEMFEAMRVKSMVVRQRHSEEYTQQLDRPSVIIDIDQILADYVRGFLDWMIEKGLTTKGIADSIRRRGGWIDHTMLMMTPGVYAAHRHEFRCSGRHAGLPVMSGAFDFLTWAKAQWQVILLTSRPIHDYPNIYGETLMWLDHNHLPYDRVWWTHDKGATCLDREVAGFVKFAVDDEFRYVLQMADLGIQTFWMPSNPSLTHTRTDRPITKITQLTDIITIYKGVTSERK